VYDDRGRWKTRADGKRSEDVKVKPTRASMRVLVRSMPCVDGRGGGKRSLGDDTIVVWVTKPQYAGEGEHKMRSAGLSSGVLKAECSKTLGHHAGAARYEKAGEVVPFEGGEKKTITMAL